MNGVYHLFHRIPDDMNNSDEELFNRMRTGDPGALKLLFKKYYSTLCRFAFSFVKNVPSAEETVSDVFLHIWLKKEDIQIRTNLKTYLYAAVRNQSLNYLRYCKNRFYSEMETIDTQNVISDFHADGSILYQELKNDVESLIRQLPEKRQIIFRMNRIDGLSYQEIADILSISVHTVQNQMTAAVKFISQKDHSRK